MARKKPGTDEESTDPNVLPVMNIMFLMIPALLLAMEVAKMAAITVSPPNFCAPGCSAETDTPSTEKPLKLEVFIRDDGFRISTAEQPQDGIPLARPAAPTDDYERYDYAALEAKAKELKAKAPNEAVVTVSAENDVPMQVLINTMDALRGSGCDPLTPEQCLFFDPIVEAGVG